MSTSGAFISAAYHSPNKRIPGKPPSASDPSKADLFASTRVPPPDVDLRLRESDTTSSSSTSSDLSPTTLPPTPLKVGSSSGALPPIHLQRPENVTSSRGYVRSSAGFFEPQIIDFAERQSKRCIFARNSCSLFMTPHPVAVCEDCYNRQMRRNKKYIGWMFKSGYCFGAWMVMYTAVIVTIVVLVMTQQRKEAMKYQRDQFWRDQQGQYGNITGNGVADTAL